MNSHQGFNSAVGNFVAHDAIDLSLKIGFPIFVTTSWTSNLASTIVNPNITMINYIHFP